VYLIIRVGAPKQLLLQSLQLGLEIADLMAQTMSLLIKLSLHGRYIHVLIAKSHRVQRGRGRRGRDRGRGDRVKEEERE
jgi:hypothetical protein